MFAAHVGAPRFDLIVLAVTLSGLVALLHGARFLAAFVFRRAEANSWPVVMALWDGALVSAALAFSASFGVLKSQIPTVNPFWADDLFTQMDTVLFFGKPWELSHKIIPSFVTPAIDFVYFLWLPMLLATILIVGMFAPEETKRRFFVSYLAAWSLLGLVIATAFSSVGPIFGDLVGGQSFLPANAPFAHAASAYLREGYVNRAANVGQGISAMPSMHVAMAWLYVLCFPKLRILTVPFFAFIAVGSVHLGWHYAIDGIVAVIGVAAIWSSSRRRSSEAERDNHRVAMDGHGVRAVHAFRITLNRLRSR
nr:phosphatase PAP2 family protein [Sphingopyxis lutea]